MGGSVGARRPFGEVVLVGEVVLDCADMHDALAHIPTLRKQADHGESRPVEGRQ